MIWLRNVVRKEKSMTESKNIDSFFVKEESNLSHSTPEKEQEIIRKIASILVDLVIEEERQKSLHSHYK